jgi:hypothetical protein
MMHSLFNNTFLAARGEKEWYDILLPIVIAIIYMVFSALRKKSENQQGGRTVQKQPSRPINQSPRSQQSRQSSHGAQNNTAVVRQAAQREYEEAKEIARRQFTTRMERISEYEQNKPMGVPDSVWQKQIENARQTVQREYQEAQQEAREEYQRVISQLPAAAPAPPVQKIRKPQPPVPAAAAQSTIAQPPPSPKSPEPQPQQPQAADAIAAVHHHHGPAKVLAHHLSFAKDDLVRGILYGEILGKPLALREDA